MVDDAKQFEAALSASAHGQGGRRVGVAGLADSNATSEALSAALHAAHARVQMERRIASAERRSDAELLARIREHSMPACLVVCFDLGRRWKLDTGLPSQQAGYAGPARNSGEGRQHAVDLN